MTHENRGLGYSSLSRTARIATYIGYWAGEAHKDKQGLEEGIEEYDGREGDPEYESGAMGMSALHCQSLEMSSNSTSPDVIYQLYETTCSDIES